MLHAFIMICYTMMLFNKESRYGSFVVLFGFVFYFAVVYWLPGEMYYAGSATINLIVGLCLFKSRKIPALLSFSLILVNWYGFSLYSNYLPPNNYDKISSFILLAQLAFIMPKGIFNAVANGSSNKHRMVRSANFDSNQLRAKMRKNQTTKEAR